MGGKGALEVKHSFNEIFDVEVDGWCYGLTHFPGEIHPAIVFRVIKELSLAFNEAVKAHYVFNVLDLALKLSRSAKYLVGEREIAFAILAELPNPLELSEEEQFIVAQIVDQVEQAYGGVVERLTRKWRQDHERVRTKRAA